MKTVNLAMEDDVIDDDYEIIEVDAGWLVLGANLESEARQAVLEDLVDSFAADLAQLGTEVVALSESEAKPGYWEVSDVVPLNGDPMHTEAVVINSPVKGTFGWYIHAG